MEWYCAFKTEKQAIAFEKYLKTGSGIAFMKKRFFKSSEETLEKDASKGRPALLSYPTLKFRIAKMEISGIRSFNVGYPPPGPAIYVRTLLI